MREIDYSKYYWKSNTILLRPPKAEDWEEQIHNMFDSAARFLFNDEIDMPVDIDEFKQFDKIDRGFICFAIENNAGKHVGIANLFGIDERHGKFGPVGIQINPPDRGKGYALAAFRMLGRYMFNERRMHKWNSGYVEGNVASAALHKKTGFTIEGIQADMVFHEGRYWNQVMCGVTETQFFENEKTLPPLWE